MLLRTASQLVDLDNRILGFTFDQIGPFRVTFDQIDPFLCCMSGFKSANRFFNYTRALFYPVDEDCERHFFLPLSIASSTQKESYGSGSSSCSALATGQGGWPLGTPGP
jgi:hypothetical protein